MPSDVDMQTQVVIIGGGPVGLFSAVLLGKQGIRTVVFEKNEQAYYCPRAVTMSGDVIRIMRQAGDRMFNFMREHKLRISDVIMNKSPVDPTARYLVRPTDEYEDYVSYDLMHRFSGFNTFHQPTLEANLRDEIERMSKDGILKFFKLHEVVGVVNNPEDNNGKGSVDVTVKNLTSDKTFKCKSNYAIACDGGTSGSRKMLGVTFAGNTYMDDPWIIFDCKVKDQAWFKENRYSEERGYGLRSSFVVDRARPHVIVEVPDPEGIGHWRFEKAVLKGETAEEMLTDAKINELLEQDLVPPSSVECIRRVVYNFHARLASQWKVGNVFLAGDAAHCQPPFTGQGMCSGLRDSANLCWKLAWVLRGKAEPPLLDSYYEERLPAQKEKIRQTCASGEFVMERRIIAVWIRNLFCYIMRWLLGDLDFLKKFIPMNLLTFVVGGFTNGAWDSMKCPHGKFVPCPELKVLKGTKKVHEEGGETHCYLDEYISMHNLTIIWIQLKEGRKGFQDAFKEEDKEWLKAADAQMVHVRTKTGSQEDDPEPGFDISLADEKGFFTTWAWKEFGKEKEILVVRPDFYVYGSFSASECDEIVPSLKARLGLA